MRSTSKLIFSFLAMLGSTAVWAEGNPYTYVKMSLLVPWTLYFVFLAAVLIPFIVLIALAWQRQQGDQKSDNEDKL